MSNLKFDPSADEYLAKHDIHRYIKDAIDQLLVYREDHAKVLPSKFLADYFRSVHEGSHTLYRDYSYISSTPHNRACFINNVWECFHNIAVHGVDTVRNEALGLLLVGHPWSRRKSVTKQEAKLLRMTNQKQCGPFQAKLELLSVKEYHSLLCLICSGFPLEMVQRAARIVLMDDALDCLMSFVDFVFAFQIQLYYEDYINLCKEPYEHLVLGSNTVFVPSTDNWQHSHSGSNHEDSKQSEGVSSQSLYEVLEKLDVKLSPAIPRPNLQHVRSELNKMDRITFHGLLMALSKNELVNNAIGVLPHRDEISSGYDITIHG